MEDKAALLQAQLSPWALNKSIGLGCSVENSTWLSGCLSSPAAPEGSSWVLLLVRDLQSAVENIIERNIQHGDAVFKVFVQSGICAAKCDIVAKVTACLLFGKSKSILNIGKL